MKCKVFIESYDNDDIDSKFDVSNYYTDSKSYIEALEKFSSSETNFMEIKKEKQTATYSKCDCIIYDDENNLMTIDKFVGYYNRDTMIMMVLSLDLDNSDDDFYSEFHNWYGEHERLNKLNVSEKERMTLEPKTDLKVVFNNLANKETYCTMSNVMFVDKISIDKYVVLVDKIIFTKSF